MLVIGEFALLCSLTPTRSSILWVIDVGVLRARAQ